MSDRRPVHHYRTRYQLRWHSEFILSTRLLLISLLALAVTLSVDVGDLPDGYFWFPLTFVGTILALLLVTWLIGEIGVTVLVVFKEWQIVFEASKRKRMQ